MKVLMLRNAARNLGCELSEGETGTVDPHLGARLVSIGIAVEVESQKQPKKVKGVPVAPSIAETTKPAILADDLDL